MSKSKSRRDKVDARIKELESEFRSGHGHGGFDCMCFEDDAGPSFFEAMGAYVSLELRRQVVR